MIAGQIFAVFLALTMTLLGAAVTVGSAWLLWTILFDWQKLG